MSNQTEVQRAFEIAWNTTPPVSYAVQYQNEAAPEIETPWVRMTFRPNHPIGVFLGPHPLSNANFITGFVQIDTFYPLLTGDQQSLSDSELIKAFFYDGKSLTYQDTRVTITSCGQTSVQEDSWYRSIITVYFSAYIDR